MSGEAAPRAITTLIAALGGEGGGVLANWVVQAAQASDLPVQATSIPGVAQRTGATTYYLEIWPQTWQALGGRVPVLALAPAIGEVDLMAATELLEAGRAVGGGFVTPDATTLIASTHRMFTTREKVAMDDGRYDAATLLAGAGNRAKRGIFFDMALVSRQAGAPTNSVLLGAMAATGILPLPEQAFRAGIQAEGKNVEANLRGFEAGLAAARAAASYGAAQDGAAQDGAAKDGAAPEGAATIARAGQAAPGHERIAAEFPQQVGGILEIAVRRLTDFQDGAYATLYLNRLAPFGEAPPLLLETLAKQLALRMSYEDAIRVAQAKTRPERLGRVRAETGAGKGDPVEITEFLKPGLEEICDILPEPLARLLFALGRAWPRLGKGRKGMYVRTNTVWGFAQLRMLAALRLWRRTTWRYRREQEAITAWLELVALAAARDAGLATEVAECARLIKGYGDTHRRGRENFQRIEAGLIRPALNGTSDFAAAAQAIAEAREAAVADPEGDALAHLLPHPLPHTPPVHRAAW